ncbi:MAG: hypothetical protein H6735_15175 [Alphaproteobacteria bacterium]|nr:hypothetical protein [Alphaproteobacteria bacterium]
MLALLPSLALALDVDPHGRWVDDGSVTIGEANATLDGGIVFPVTDGDRRVGFVFVGGATLSSPVATTGDALSVRAALPDLPLRAGERWDEPGEVLLAVGLRDELLAGAELGYALTGDSKTVSFVGEDGREHVLVTALTPRRALDRAQAALHDRSRALRAARLDLDAMLAREAFRAGEARAIVELRPEHDLGALIGAVDDSADLGRTWLTWVVDPTGLVDQTRGQVLAVHGQGADQHPVRILTGVPLEGPPAWSIRRGELNLVLDPPIGTSALARDQARLEIAAGERGRWLDLWIPQTPSALRHGQVVVGGEPEITLAALADGTPLASMDLPFGPRRPGEDWIERGFLLPEEVDEGQTVSVRLDWQEAWDVSGIFNAKEWVAFQMRKLDPGTFQPAVPDGVPAVMSLGRVTAGVPVMPSTPTGNPRWPAEVRAGTVTNGYQMSLGGGARGEPYGDGELWVGTVDGPTTVTGGDLTETRDGAFASYPAVRLLQHGQVFDRHMPERIRAILHFYGTALPPWPHDEAVVIHGQDHPVMIVVRDPQRVPDDPQSPPEVRYIGQGQIVLDSVVAIPVVASTDLNRSLRNQWPHAAERGLAEALAAGWFGDLAWTDRDRWLGRAIPKVFRDRFVEEAWGAKVTEPWEAATDQRLSREAPSDGLQSLVGTDDWWADEVGARFLGRAIEARIGERALLEGLSRLATSEDPSLDRLVTELEEVSRTSLRDTFDAFVVAGLRPSLEGEWEQDGDRIRVHLVADVPLGTYEIPVVARKGRSQTTAWIRVVDGVGEGSIPASEADDVSIDPDRVMPLRGRGPLRHSSGQG